MTLALSAGLAVVWLVLAGLFVGVGALLLGACGTFDATWRSMHAAFWAGVSAVTVFLLVWHLVLPVDGLALAVFVISGILGLLRHRRSLADPIAVLGPLPLAAAVLVAIWVGNHALNLGAYDDYNYEFQAVRWDHDFPIVPGLANLHGRLGFNESHHLLAAMLSAGPLAGRVNHVLNGLFVVVLLTACLGALASLARPRDTRSASTTLQAVFVTPLVGLVLFGEFGSMISTLKADVIVACAVFAAVIFLLEFAEAAPGTRAYGRAGATVLLVCAFGISVKLSAVTFGAIIAFATIRRAFVDAGASARAVPGAVQVATAVAALAFLLVPLRGIILSGYPAYPLPVGATSVDWRVNPAEAAIDRQIIRSMAEGKPTYELRDLPLADWLPEWSHHIALDAKFTVLVPGLLVLMLMAGRAAEWRGPRLARSAWAGRTVIVACLAALVVWWVAAPAPRFGLQYAWVLAGWAVLTACDGPGWPWRSALAAATTAACVVAMLLRVADVASADRLQILVVCGGAWACLTWLARRPSNAAVVALPLVLLAAAEPAGRMIAALIHRPAEAMQAFWLTPDDYYGTGESIFPTIARQTRSGLTVYLPGRARYETPLPNTRFFNPSLELRRPGSLAYGFRARQPADETGPGYSLDFSASRDTGPHRDTNASR